MPKDIQRVYLDTCVFIAVFNQERHISDDHGDNRFDASFSILKQGEDRKAEIYTSMLTLAECPQDSSMDGKSIMDFFEQEWIHVVEVDRFVVEDSRVVQQEKIIKPMDAIHIATARMIGDINAVFSYDKNFINAAQQLLRNARVCHPILYWDTKSIDF